MNEREKERNLLLFELEYERIIVEYSKFIYYIFCGDLWALLHYEIVYTR